MWWWIIYKIIGFKEYCSKQYENFKLDCDYKIGYFIMCLRSNPTYYKYRIIRTRIIIGFLLRKKILYKKYRIKRAQWAFLKRKWWSKKK